MERTSWVLLLVLRSLDLLGFDSAGSYDHLYLVSSLVLSFFFLEFYSCSFVVPPSCAHMHIDIDLFGATLCHCIRKIAGLLWMLMKGYVFGY